MSVSGWIIYNKFLPGNKFYDFAQMLYDAALERNHQVQLKTNADVLHMVGRKIQTKQKDKLPDYVLFTDKDIYLAQSLEMMGIKVFNSAAAIEISDDKIKTYQQLAFHNIPIPHTIIAPKTFGFDFSDSDEFLQMVKKQFAYPFIIKEAFGSFGEQVYLVKNDADLRNILHIVKDVPFVFQQFIDTSYGVDLRLQVVGDDVVTAMKRTSDADFRANITSGGKMLPYEPNEQEKKLAIQATKAIGADFAGVDLLFGKQNERLVCEVNSNAHIRNLYDCTGINAAHPIVRYVEKTLFNNTASEK